MELGGFLAVARRWWSTILIATWVAGLAGFFTASGVPPTYEGHARILVGPVVADTNVLRGAASVTSTYAELVSSPSVIDGARESLGLPPEVPWVVRATADETTRILVIRAEHGDAALAAGMANALAEALQELAPDEIAIPEGQLTVIEPAVVPTVPISPQVTLITILAAGAGALASTILVLLIEYLGNTVSTTRDLTDLTGKPLLGFASLGKRFRPTDTAPVIVEAQPDSRAAAAVRLIATKALYADTAQPIRTVLVLGTAARDGAADLAANIGSALARTGRRTVLVDANQDGEVTQIFRAEGAFGLADLVDGRADVESAALSHGPGLSVVPAGLGGSVDLFDAEVAQKVLDQLRPRYDLIIVNAAPVDRSGNALVWARSVEGTVIVAERDRTNRDDLRYALEHLAGVGARVLGSVLVDHPPRLRRGQASRSGGRGEPDRVARPPAATRVTGLGASRERAAARSLAKRDVGPQPQPGSDVTPR